MLAQWWSDGEDVNGLGGLVIMLGQWVEWWGRCQWVGWSGNNASSVGGVTGKMSMGRVVWGVGRVRIRSETYVEFEELSEEELFS